MNSQVTNKYECTTHQEGTDGLIEFTHQEAALFCMKWSQDRH